MTTDRQMLRSVHDVLHIAIPCLKLSEQSLFWFSQCGLWSSCAISRLVITVMRVPYEMGRLMTGYFESLGLSVVARSILPNMCPPIGPCCHVPA